MSFIKEFLTPFITMIAIILIVVWVGYLIYKGIKKFCPHPDLWWKYKVKKAWDEKKVRFCYDAIEKGITPEEVKKLLLLSGNSMEEAEEIIYIQKVLLKKVEKEVGK